MKTFDELWKDIVERSQRWAIPIVQDRTELEHVFNLMKGLNSYLEVGSAEGNSLYVLVNNMSPMMVDIIDFGETHTKGPREEAIRMLGLPVKELLGNSHCTKIIDEVQDCKYDCVLIDAGHTYEDVIADAIAYGHLATKYIFFHDIQIPDVKRAFDWYCAQNPQFKRSEFINSTNYGFGILEV